MAKLRLRAFSCPSSGHTVPGLKLLTAWGRGQRQDVGWDVIEEEKVNRELQVPGGYHWLGWLLHLCLVWPWTWGLCYFWVKRIYIIRLSSSEEGMVENLGVFLSQRFKNGLCTQMPGGLCTFWFWSSQARPENLHCYPASQWCCCLRS